MRMKRPTVDWRVCRAEAVLGIIFFKIGEVCCWSAKHVRTGYSKWTTATVSLFLFSFIHYWVFLPIFRVSANSRLLAWTMCLSTSIKWIVLFIHCYVGSPASVKSEKNPTIIHDGQVSLSVKFSFVCMQIKCGWHIFITNKLFFPPSIIIQLRTCYAKTWFYK